MPPELNDQSPVRAGELAGLLRVSRWTVGNWRREGYQFLYGNMTSAEHAKQWLIDRAKRKHEAKRAAEAEIAARLRQLR